MQITTDYHTHTTYSHGLGSVEDNVRAAVARGLSTIAITDHGFGHLYFGIRRNALQALRADIDAANARYGESIRVLMGVEANIVGYDGHLDLTPDDDALFDIVLAGIHTGLRSADKHFLLYLWLMGRRNTAANIRRNTDMLIGVIQSQRVNIITHPGHKYLVDHRALADAAAGTNTALEINASHAGWTVEALAYAKEVGCRFSINSDAHSPARVGDFDAAVQLALQAGLTQEDILQGL